MKAQILLVYQRTMLLSIDTTVWKCYCHLLAFSLMPLLWRPSRQCAMHCRVAVLLCEQNVIVCVNLGKNLNYVLRNPQLVPNDLTAWNIQCSWFPRESRQPIIVHMKYN